MPRRDRGPALDTKLDTRDVFFFSEQPYKYRHSTTAARIVHVPAGGTVGAVTGAGVTGGVPTPEGSAVVSKTGVPVGVAGAGVTGGVTGLTVDGETGAVVVGAGAGAGVSGDTCDANEGQGTRRARGAIRIRQAGRRTGRGLGGGGDKKPIACCGSFTLLYLFCKAGRIHILGK